MNAGTVEVIIDRALYRADSFVVFAAHDSAGGYLRVRSSRLIDPAPGETYQVKGEIKEYKDQRGLKWRQIDSTEMSRIGLSGALLIPWLQKMPNVGPARAKRLHDAFQDDLPAALSSIDHLPEVARKLEPGKPILANKIAVQLHAKMTVHMQSSPARDIELKFMAALESLGVHDPSAARNLWRLIGGGPNAIERLQRNAYLGACILPWKQADHVGKKLLAQAHDLRDLDTHPSRLLGAVDNAWREVLGDGDTAASPEDFRTLLVRRKVDVEAAISLAFERRAIAGSSLLYRAPGAMWIEDSLVAQLQALNRDIPALSSAQHDQIRAAVRESEHLTGLALYDEQCEAVERLLAKPIAALQGGAGVGKTTVMKVLVTAWEAMGGNVVMCALAGKAALQLSRGTSTRTQPRLAYTIARLLLMLEATAEADEKGKSLSEPMRFDEKTLLLIDEASMVDTPSLHSLVRYLPRGARLLLVGDRYQLPPVGIGAVFHDIVSEGSRVVELNTVRRQASGNPVIDAADIRMGRVPEIEEWKGQRAAGIYLLEDPTKLHPMYDELCNVTEDIMVVAALRNTVDKFNKAASTLKRIRLYGHDKGLRLGPLASVAVNEPVVCTKNYYEHGLFNGLLGKVAVIDGDAVFILWDGEIDLRLVDADYAADIELAFGITCHRAQGSAAKYVIVVLEDSLLVPREWLYTAVTRTRETVILVGDKSTLSNTVSRRARRVTGFEIGTQPLGRFVDQPWKGSMRQAADEDLGGFWRHERFFIKGSVVFR